MIEVNLMRVIMEAAEELIQCYNSGLSNSALIRRMKYIAEELNIMANKMEVEMKKENEKAN